MKEPEPKKNKLNVDELLAKRREKEAEKKNDQFIQTFMSNLQDDEDSPWERAMGYYSEWD